MARGIYIEVERKFKALNFWPFVPYKGNPAFNSLVYLGHITLHDRYFDLQDTLSRPSSSASTSPVIWSGVCDTEGQMTMT
jgi:hypothetical protein